jgi:hypothetical protein
MPECPVVDPMAQSSMNRAPPELCALPIELVENIARGLRRSGLCSLRLTCKALYQKTTHAFSLRLTKVRTTLSSTSLQRLEGLSRHEKFRGYARTLVIEEDVDRYFGHGFSWSRQPSGCLKFPHPAVHKLQEILLRLENCRSFRISSGYEWREGKDCLGNTDALAIILHVIAEGSIPVKTVILEPVWYPWDHTLLHLPTYQTPKFKCAWSHLQSLGFHYRLGIGDVNWMTELVVHATGLKYLSLKGWPRNGDLINMLSSYGKLPNLEELSIVADFCIIRRQVLSNFLLLFKDTLRELRLRKVSLEDTWEPVLGLLKTDFPILDTVSLSSLKMMKLTTGDPPTVISRRDRDLRLGVFSRLSENARKLGFQDEEFTNIHEKPWAGESRLDGIRYSGREKMGEALDVIMQSIEYIK